MLRLHGFWRSGTSHRVRIALELKGIGYEYVAVDLPTGEHLRRVYGSLNPQGLVPALETPHGVLVQSPAILEWLEDEHPKPQLLPLSSWDRSVVRSMCAMIACDVHPLNNLRVLKTLRHEFAADEQAIKEWTARWISAAFGALEAKIRQHGGGFAFGESPTLADRYLVPQIYSAKRFDVDLSAYPEISTYYERVLCSPSFQAAAPEEQPDAAPIE